MRKIPTLFVRDGRYVTAEVTPGCEWVLAGEGIATRKFDGTCVRFDGVQWWTRREVKPGKPTPPGFMREQYDPTTGKTVGWEPGEQSPFAKYLKEATPVGSRWLSGTYELCGPKVNGNPEGFDAHVLVTHGAEKIIDLPCDFDGLRDWLRDSDFEGIVWHHPDGRMAKIKRRDFP